MHVLCAPASVDLAAHVLEAAQCTEAMDGRARQQHVRRAHVQGRRRLPQAAGCGYADRPSNALTKDRYQTHLPSTRFVGPPIADLAHDAAALALVASWTDERLYQIMTNLAGHDLPTLLEVRFQNLQRRGVERSTLANDGFSAEPAVGSWLGPCCVVGLG